ncbi:MAG TPA: hypothetical protein VH458_13395 [Vicinamibacterales bacterium]|jgi:hypothetical protein
MADRLREQEMRLTIPAAGEFRAVATELAGRFAEYSGSTAGDAAELRKTIERLAARVTNGAGPDASIDLDMIVQANVLVVRVSSGSTSGETTCPLSD